MRSLTNPEFPALKNSTRPLQGVKVIEFCNVAASPFCAMLLSDFGADVVKVESPEE